MLRRRIGHAISWDSSVGIGRYAARFYIRDTVNASFGSDNLTRFTPGSCIQREKSLDIDLAYRLTSAVHQHVGAGVEWREEQFQVVAGDLTGLQASGLTRVSVLAPMVSQASGQTS